MQLDRTHISIRERTMMENLDLSLHIVREFFWPLIICLVIGVAPFAIINHFLFGWMLEFEFGISYPIRFIWVSICLIILEAPLATVFLTAYLGQAVFDQQPKLSTVIRHCLSMYGRIFWCVWIRRGVLIGMVLLLFADRGGIDTYFVEAFWLPLLLLVVLSIRAFRPFLNEIIVLEQNPLRATTTRRLSIGSRSSILHNPSMSDVFAGSMTVWFFAFLLVLVVFGGCLVASGIFLHDWRQGYILIGFCLPLSMWIVVGFIAIARFLGYLDLRIRQEGWEVEVLVRAEAAALEHRML